MSDIDISPLAKRLADENNVDWRTLHGTGDNGRVVERDVLDYLARVMAGDEDLDPTPEPLPAGMESWSDQETFAGGDSTWVGTAGDGGSSSEGSDTVWADPEEELLDQDVSADSPDTQGVDQGETGSEAETGWFTETDGTGDRPGDTGSDPIGAEPAFELEPDTGSDSDTDIDEDIFVFEDEPAGRAAPAERADDGGSWADDVAGFGERSGESTSSDFAGDDFFALDSEEQTDPNAGDGRGFSWGEPESAAPTGTDSGLTGPGLTSSEPTDLESTEPDFTGPSSTDPAPAELESAEPDFTEPDFTEPDFTETNLTESDLTEPEPTGLTPTQPDFSEPEPNITPWETQPREADSFADAEPGTPWEAATFTDEVRAEERAGAGGEVQEEAHGHGEALPNQDDGLDSNGSDTPWDGADSSYEASYANPTETADFAGPLPAGVSLEETETRVADSAAAAADAPQPAAGEAVAPQPSQSGWQDPAPVTRVRGFSGSGIVLRRDVDLSALQQAQQAVSHELGLTETIAPASFLLRAAARAGRPWPLTTVDAAPSLATLTDDGVAVTYLPRASDMPFRELVVACSAPAGDHDVESTALVVADLSVLGIDEAVLDLGRPVLTLGRILPQVPGDRFRGTLALSGPIAPDAGSRFLARVVELLAAPVRLVL